MDSATMLTLPSTCLSGILLSSEPNIPDGPEYENQDLASVFIVLIRWLLSLRNSAHTLSYLQVDVRSTLAQKTKT